MTSENPSIAAAIGKPCGCTAPSAITDQTQHDSWHALVIAQGGPAGRCDAETLQEARGMSGQASLGPMPYRGKVA